MSSSSSDSSKSWKREVSLALFLLCNGYPIYAGDSETLKVTFLPTLALVGGSFNYDAYLKNNKK